MTRKTLLLLANPEFDKRFNHGISRLYYIFCKEHRYNLEIIHRDTLKNNIPDKDSEQLVIIAGGDGTIHHAINSVPEEYFDRYLWGIIPAGTANEFAKSLCIPLSLTKSAKLIATPKTIYKQHIGIVNNQIRFATGLLYGIASHIVGHTPKIAKHVLGNAAFYFIFLEFLFRFWNSRKGLIEQFNLNSKPFRTNYLLINNADLISKNIEKYTIPQEDMNKFYIIYIHSKISRSAILRLMLREFLHKHVLHDPALYYGQAKDILLEFDEELEFMIDGEEYRFESPLNINYFRKPMNIICE